MNPFFPHPLFAWLAYLVLVLLCAVTAAIDWKRLRIPNQCTVLILVAGVIMNLVRAGWLGWQGEPGQYFHWTGIAGGVAEGLLFSLAGFAAGFALFFLLWQLGTCGGGDVKLMAALGAWVGPYWLLWVLLGTYVAVVLILIAWWILALLKIVPAKRSLSYAPAAFLSVALVLLWVWRRELLLI